MMDKLPPSYSIAVGLVGFGAWVLALGIAIGIISVATGLLNMYDELNKGSR